MDHSVQAYVKRLPTERLKVFIQQYDAGLLEEDFSNAIPMLRAELRRRETENSGGQKDLPKAD